MSQYAPFGDPSRHYVSAPPLLKGQTYGEEYRREESMIRGLLERHSGEAQQTVERARKRWNQTIRDQLRTETRFNLGLGDDRQSVPVRVVDGLPLPFAAPIRRGGTQASRPDRLATSPESFEADDDRVWPAAPGGQPRGHHAQPFLAHNAPTKEDLNREWGFISEILGDLKRQKLEESLKQIDEDLLGAYFFQTPEICLYWMPIGMVASMLSVSVEALTVVVLAHELAHAYTHLGRDIDGGKWETSVFAKTELGVAEGLAQFYTQAVCAKLADRLPEAMRAYEELMKMQPDTLFCSGAVGAGR